ncbi:MAG: IS256 family transposase [Betaproteobacteria bacterium]|jgi:putative transposase|nr:IS256 family transposase [Betaproteobacteria bacterium]
MDKTKLQELANEFAKGIKTQHDLNDFTKMLTKMAVETALNAELTDHLGYEKHQNNPEGGTNARNGSTKKRLKGNYGEVEIESPRDREGSFEPQLLPKHQSRLTQMDDQILTLYAKGLSTREIVSAFKEMYDADVSATLISKVTERVLEQITSWQARPLDAIYPIVYLDCIVIKIRENQTVINKAVYLALGVNMDGHKDLLGIWVSENEGAKFWLSVLTELKSRGVQDILIACVDGLKGFPEAIAAEYPETRIQLCIVHMLRGSLKYVSWKDYKKVTTDLKEVYQATTEAQALKALENFGITWNSQYPQIAKSWTNNWVNLRTIFDYPPEIRKAIYTTNAIESLNSVIRSATKRRKLFPNQNSAMKVVYLAIMQASKKWTMPIQNWRSAMNRFEIEFGERLNLH